MLLVLHVVYNQRTTYILLLVGEWSCWRSTNYVRTLTVRCLLIAFCVLLIRCVANVPYELIFEYTGFKWEYSSLVADGLSDEIYEDEPLH